MTATIRLGDHVLPIVPQRHARLRHALTGEDVQQLLGGEYAQHAYRLLCVLAPALADAMPQWEFEGYESAEAAEADAYDPEQDRSPTMAEIVDAFETGINVNGGAKLKRVFGLVDSLQAMNTRTEATNGAPPTTAPAETDASLASPGNTGG